jgi:hypothetical protein
MGRYASVAKPAIGLDRESVGASDRSGGMAQKYTPFATRMRGPPARLPDDHQRNAMLEFLLAS